MQLAEKAWCAPAGFRRSFLAALDRYGIAPDAELARSFAVGFGLYDPGQRKNDGFVALGDLVRPRSPSASALLRASPAAPAASAPAPSRGCWRTRPDAVSRPSLLPCSDGVAFEASSGPIDRA